MTKKELRDGMKNRLAALDKLEYETYSKQIESRFLMEKDVAKSNTIGITISSFPEVNTEGIIKALWEAGKTVVVPKCSPKERTMTFYKIDRFDQLETVYMQLLEPNPLVTTPVQVNDIELLVVPGIVYNHTGYRIGYGGGYYDRFLANYKGLTISLAFDFQLVNSLDQEEFDLPIDKIITDSKTIPCQLNRKEE